MVAEGGVRREVVDVPPVVVVVGQPGCRPGGRDQGVHLLGGLFGGLGAEDLAQPGAQLVHLAQVVLGEGVDLADLLPDHEGVERRGVGQQLGAAHLGCGVEQLDEDAQGALGVMGDQHVEAPRAEGAVGTPRLRVIPRPYRGGEGSGGGLLRRRVRIP